MTIWSLRSWRDRYCRDAGGRPFRERNRGSDGIVLSLERQEENTPTLKPVLSCLDDAPSWMKGDPAGPVDAGAVLLHCQRRGEGHAPGEGCALPCGTA